MLTLPRRAALGALPAFLLAARAQAQAASPVQVVERFHAALLEIMKNADRLGIRGRERQIRPEMMQAWNLPAMARIACGQPWNGFTPEQREAITQAFVDYSVTTYAARFDGFSGESFQTHGENAQANGDQMIRTQINRTGGEGPVQLNYLLRKAQDGSWKIVDIYLTGTISELASRRAEFTALLRDGGPDRLASELRRRTADMLK